ncbi:hypothetical protein H5410_040166 [Solanum commersonii]|uniref:Uncharacterized protein n=1 Tax=Solanum commersonii TaxID=4109 RepID=A0A9J5XQK6_SOLCO|nr:hypothetical protein H5410_040166 [Solanum commersonii]
MLFEVNPIRNFQFKRGQITKITPHRIEDHTIIPTIQTKHTKYGKMVTSQLKKIKRNGALHKGIKETMEGNGSKTT